MSEKLWTNERVKHEIDSCTKMTWDEFGHESDPMVEDIDVQVLMLRMRDEMQNCIDELEAKTLGYQEVAQEYGRITERAVAETVRLCGLLPDAEMCAVIRSLINESVAIAGGADPAWGDELRRWAQQTEGWLDSLESELSNE